MSNVTAPMSWREAASGPISLRARMLLALEAVFAPVEAPQSGEQIAAWELAKAAGSYADAAAEVGGLSGRCVLDFGCGWGGETAWLAERADRAVGCDIAAESLEHGEALKRKLGYQNLDFALIREGRLPFEDQVFDAVFSTNVFEHVMDVPAALGEIARVLRPGGSFVTRFGPLFHSPLGYHVCWATQVPYAHLLFGLRPIAEVARLKRPGDAITSWQAMGLNRITFPRFKHAVKQSGLDIRRLSRIPVRHHALLAHLPGIPGAGVGNLFTFGIDCHLVKR